MIDKQKIKAVAFDFGGTLDSPFLHWMDIYIKLYNEEFDLGLTKENFREIYVQTERMIDNEKMIEPNFSLFDTQYCKASCHFKGFAMNGLTEDNTKELINRAATIITTYSTSYVREADIILNNLRAKYQLFLVSNYYGNLKKVISDLGIDNYFISLTDSTVENIRKPNPELWKLAIERCGYMPEEVLIVGDSMKNDILPGLELGCQVIQGVPALQTSYDKTITQITSLKELITLL